MSGILSAIVNGSQVAIGIGCWCTCSIGMMLFNKLAIKQFPHECTLVALQMAFSVVFLAVFAGKSIHIGSVKDVARWTAVIPFFCGMLLTSMLALKHAPMSLVVVFRSLSPIISLGIERLYPEPLQVNKEMIATILMMIMGGAMYASQLPYAAMTGIFWVMLNNFFAIGDRLLQRIMLAKDQCPVDISKTGCTMLLNLEGLLPMMVGMIMTSEFREAPAALMALDAYGAFLVTASCVVGVGISYTGIWAQSLISATSFLVLINANKFAIIFIEAFIMNNKHLNGIQIVAALVTILGGCFYGKARERLEAENAKLAKEEATEKTNLMPNKV
eukprot:TRINITY_DN96112_c0_g1_i1.p1 TRINITY_DN96112_c0_g1~~TRINITY_DN96112_c0_g1_i1.p1  ORF type:complete len:330 (-),score=74.22 TRINITY_DN96112_c0_g1_i1:138-1127(-)